MIIEDSRQKDGKHRHIESWMRAHGVEFEPRASALDFGDYIREGSNISVDTKKDVQEVVCDIGRDHARFVRELERARAAGWRLVVLVEQHPEYNDREKLADWVPYQCKRCGRCDDPSTATRCSRYRFKPMQGTTVARTLKTLERKHGCVFEFCRKQDTARRICEILGEVYRR